MSRDCHICHHQYPSLRLCSACGPACEPCQQALDAARYRFLRANAQPFNLTMDAVAHWHIPSFVFGIPTRTFDLSVDRAMEAMERAQNHACPEE